MTRCSFPPTPSRIRRSWTSRGSQPGHAVPREVHAREMHHRDRVLALGPYTVVAQRLLEILLRPLAEFVHASGQDQRLGLAVQGPIIEDGKCPGVVAGGVGGLALSEGADVANGGRRSEQSRQAQSQHTSHGNKSHDNQRLGGELTYSKNSTCRTGMMPRFKQRVPLSLDGRGDRGEGENKEQLVFRRHETRLGTYSRSRLH